MTKILTWFTIAIAGIVLLGSILLNTIWHCNCMDNLANLAIACCNVGVFAILTLEVINVTKQSADKQVKQAKIIAKMELSHEVFLKVWKALNKSYEILQEKASANNEQAYDAFKVKFYNALSELNMITPEISKLESYKWWVKDFEQIDEHFRTHPSFDFNNHSIKSSPKLWELFQEISDLIYRS